MSQVVCNKDEVLDIATKALNFIDKLIADEKEEYITSITSQKTWWGYGRFYTRDEALSQLRNDTWNFYHWIDSTYDESKDCFNRLIKAISICKNKTNVLLSTKDAARIARWKEKMK